MALAMTLAAHPAGAVATTGAEQDVSASVTGLRSGRGVVLACLTALPAAFPDCRHDPAARKIHVAADKAGVMLHFGTVAPGTYAISVFHDENANGKLDKVILVPKEGYGFSRDAAVVMGPPRFSAAAFAVAAQPVHQTLKMRYMF